MKVVLQTLGYSTGAFARRALRSTTKTREKPGVRQAEGRLAFQILPLDLPQMRSRWSTILCAPAIALGL